MNENRDLISIIIPVYNVEKYLKRCLESVIAQTYSNIEIILIDDGSSDKSSQICDAFKGNDSRIIVIQQKNKGVALSRNIGIEKASGLYVTFVDSDDYISPIYIEQLYKTMFISGKKITACSHCHSPEDLAQIINNEYSTYSSHDAIKEILTEGIISPSPWGKLYHMELFKDICYPDVAIGEDYCTTPRLFYASCGIAFIDSPLYCYSYNEESITKSSFNPRHLQYFEAAKILNEFLSSSCKDLIEYGICRDVNVAMAYYIKMCRDKYNNSEHKRRVLEIIRQYYRPFLKSTYPIKKKIAILGFVICPDVISFFLR